MSKKNDVCRCIARVYRWGALRPHRCSGPVWKDGYCKTHHTDHIETLIAEKDWEIERLKEDVARYKKVRQLNVNEFHNLFVKSISDNRSFDTLVDELDNINAERIDDGFGCTWSKTCPNCGGKSMEIVRPGKAQCSICG